LMLFCYFSVVPAAWTAWCTFTDTINNKYYDLNSMKNPLDWIKSTGNGIYYLNICQKINYNCSNETPVSCCQSAGAANYGCGKLVKEDSVFSSLGKGIEGVMIKYGNGDTCSKFGARNVIMNITCQQGSGIGTIVNYSETGCTYSFVIASQYGCATSVSPSPGAPASKSASKSIPASPSKSPSTPASKSVGASDSPRIDASPSATPSNGTDGRPSSSKFDNGWIFVIVFSCSFVIYFGVGFVYKARVKELGWKPDAIPNVEFWKDFPFLIKDGIVFSCTKIYQLIRRGRGDYHPI